MGYRTLGNADHPHTSFATSRPISTSRSDLDCQLVAQHGAGKTALRADAELIQGTSWLASSMRRLRSSAFSNSPLLVVTSPRIIFCLWASNVAARSFPPVAYRIPKITVTFKALNKTLAPQELRKLPRQRCVHTDMFAGRSVMHSLISSAYSAGSCPDLRPIFFTLHTFWEPAWASWVISSR